jgi:hypothetical protein
VKVVDPPRGEAGLAVMVVMMAILSTALLATLAASFLGGALVWLERRLHGLAPAGSRAIEPTVLQRSGHVAFMTGLWTGGIAMTIVLILTLGVWIRTLATGDVLFDVVVTFGLGSGVVLVVAAAGAALSALLVLCAAGVRGLARGIEDRLPAR